MQLADTYIPGFVAEAAPVVAQFDTGTGGIISRMADAGLAQADVVEDVTQVPATADQTAALGVQDGAPLLTITHVGRTEDGRLVEVTRHVLGEGWTLRYGVPLD
ncbi:UTRA domain-containing protein [Streptomyces sp. S07_1.15]|nr:UTRA domain-containing protein [Streptomyces sp. S07_1.15]